MKKTLLTTIIGTAVAVSAMAQGTINFDNFTPDLSIITPIYAPNPGNPTVSQTGQSADGSPSGSTVYGGALLQGTRYEMDLFAGPAGTVDPNLLTLVTSGTFQTSGGNTLPAGLINSVNDVPIPGVAAGSSAVLQVRVWDTQSGSSFANAGIKGSSGLFGSGALGGVGPTGPVIPPDVANGAWSSFSLAASAVPEPGTFALAGLGAAALLIFRRRK